MSFIEFRRQKLFEAIDALDLHQVKRLLVTSQDDFGDDWNYRDRDGRSVYAHIVRVGVTQMIAVFISHGVPLGDALLRASDLGMVEIVSFICRYASTLPKKKRIDVIECHCENDDYHPTTTPLMAAAHRNNFTVVKILLDFGAKLVEPAIDQDPAGLTETVVLFMQYRALASEAYITQAFSDPLDFAFGLSRRLRKLGDRWEDKSEELGKIAERVEKFAGDFMGQASSTSEVLSILRVSRGQTKHPVAKIRAAVMANQKPFVIHPFTQRALSDCYYQKMKEQNQLLSWCLTLMALVCYPILSLAYLVHPATFLEQFMKIPNIKLFLNVGADLTLMGCIISLLFVNFTANPVTTLGLEFTIFIFCIGISLDHCKLLYHHGPKNFVSHPMAALDSVMVIAAYITLYVAWVGRLVDSYTQRALQRQNESQENVYTTTVTLINATNTPWSSTITPSTSSSNTDLPTWLVAEWNDPRVISHALYGIVIFLCVIRTFYVLTVNHVGIFVIAESVVGMASDVARISVLYVFIVLAFSTGITRVSHYRWQRAYDKCVAEGRMGSDCALPRFNSIPSTVLDLYWSFFGLLKSPDLGLVYGPDDDYLSYLAAFIFLFYSIAAIIVLLNLLIAVITSRYSTIEQNADREWKFSRARLWLSFIADDITLPPPFNILPSVKRIRQTVAYCYKGKREEVSETKKVEAFKSLQHEYKESKRVNRLMAGRFVKSRFSANQHTSAVDGGAHALFALTRADLFTFRNEWAELRQHVSKAEHRLSIMLRKLIELAEQISLRLRVITSIESRHEADVEEVADIQDTLNELEEQLTETEELLQVVLTAPLDDEIEKEHSKTKPPLSTQQFPHKEPLIQGLVSNEPLLEEPARGEHTKEVIGDDEEEEVIDGKEDEEETVVDVDEGKTEKQVKLEIVKMMARLYEQGKRPEDDEEFVRKLANYRMKYENA